MAGLISDRDIKEAGFFHGPGELLVEEIMSTDVVSAPPSALVTDMVYAMLVKKINAVPILNDNENLVGIFTSYDLMRLVLDFAAATDESQKFGLSNLLPFPEGQSIEWSEGKDGEPEQSELPNFPGA